MSTEKISVQATVVAPLHKVWDVFVLPEHITKWNFASDDWHCPHASNDLKVGGKYCATMAAKDGSFSFDFEAIYNDIRPHELIAYTMLDGREVSTLFLETEEGIMVTTVFDAENENTTEVQQFGWQAILNNFKQYAEAL